MDKNTWKKARPNTNRGTANSKFTFSERKPLNMVSHSFHWQIQLRISLMQQSHSGEFLESRRGTHERESTLAGSL